MKKFIIPFIAAMLMIACQPQSKDAASSGNPDYEKNLATLKTFNDAFQKGDSNALGDLIDDNVKFSSAMYGDSLHTKAHFLDWLKMVIRGYDHLTLSNATYLPGIDSATHVFDGSVRYYGEWSGTFRATNIHGAMKFYGTYDFTKDHKIATADEYFDMGGISNAVMPKAK